MSHKWIDISAPIDPEQIPVWPGAPAIEISQRRCMARGDTTDDSNVSMNLHVGTHLDAPRHFLKDGATIDALSLDAMIGPCSVVSFEDAPLVTAELLKARVKSPRDGGPTRLLFKTRNSQRWSKEFIKDFTALSLDGARWLVAEGFELVGNDYLSIQPFGGDNNIHKVLLEKPVVVVEGLQLAGIAPGTYEMICLPMKFVGIEAAPARVVIREIK
jgi:arylformamidase